MNINNLLKEDSIILNAHCLDKDFALDIMIERHYICQHINDKEDFKKAILARESLSSTGVGGLIAIPHAQDESVNYPSLVAMVVNEGVEFQSQDSQPVKLLFMIAVPKNSESKHLEILAQLSQILMNQRTVELLINAKTPKEFLDILNNYMIKEETVYENDIDIIAVTACPTGIAHTYMAAKSLEEMAKRLGIRIKVETNGASGIKNKLTKTDIQEAKCVIIAADKKVEMDRFKGKPVIQVAVSEAIHNAQQLIEMGLNQSVPIYKEHDLINHKKDENISSKGNMKRRTHQIYNHLMNGFSQIIPMLMIYGIITEFLNHFTNNTSQVYLDGISQMGLINSANNFAQLALTLSAAVLSGYIADSISGKVGFVIAFISSGLFLMNTYFIIIAIIFGFLVGYMVELLKKLLSYLPEVIQCTIPNLILPLSASLIMIIIISFLPQTGNEYTTNPVFINDNPLLLIIIGFVLGAMMSIDMGGPINKIAYIIGMIGIFIHRNNLMSAVMVAGMLPPIIISLTMFITPSLFPDSNRKDKWNCLVKGLCFVSEEAIPYMTKDKKGVHIPCIIASGLAGALVMFFECGQIFPHGGILTLPFINNPILFFISLVASSLIGMSLILIFKKSSD